MLQHSESQGKPSLNKRGQCLCCNGANHSKLQLSESHDVATERITAQPKPRIGEDASTAPEADTRLESGGLRSSTAGGCPTQSSQLLAHTKLGHVTHSQNQTEMMRITRSCSQANLTVLQIEQTYPLSHPNHPRTKLACSPSSQKSDRQLYPACQASSKRSSSCLRRR